MDSPRIRCRCNNCSGEIEFESRRVGETVACPHCNLETQLFASPDEPLKANPTAKQAAVELGGPMAPSLSYVWSWTWRVVFCLAVLSLIGSVLWGFFYFFLKTL